MDLNKYKSVTKEGKLVFKSEDKEYNSYNDMILNKLKERWKK